MFFEDLLTIVGREPVFNTGLLLAGDVNPDYLRRQLSEWVNAGKLWQLRRGLYAIAPPYQKVAPHPFLVANKLVPGSYVSLQAALSYYSLIPEHVAAVTSVTTGRPSERETPLGHFIYRHIQPDLLFGYERLQVGHQQYAFVATPAKALLDLVYLEPEGDSRAYLESLRLQNLDLFNVEQLQQVTEQAGKPKLQRAARLIGDQVTAEADAYEML